MAASSILEGSGTGCPGRHIQREVRTRSDIRRRRDAKVVGELGNTTDVQCKRRKRCPRPVGAARSRKKRGRKGTEEKTRTFLTGDVCQTLTRNCFDSGAKLIRRNDEDAAHT